MNTFVGILLCVLAGTAIARCEMKISGKRWRDDQIAKEIKEGKRDYWPKDIKKPKRYSNLP